MAQIDCNNHSNYEMYYIGWPKTVKTSFSLTAHIFKKKLKCNTDDSHNCPLWRRWIPLIVELTRKNENEI